MAPQFTSVSVYAGRWDGDPTPRWFVVGEINDGTDIIFDMQLTQEAAAASARETAKDLDVPMLHVVN